MCYWLQSVKLSAEDIAAINSIFHPEASAGARYAHMVTVIKNFNLMFLALVV